MLNRSLRLLLAIYRCFQYRLCGRHKYGVMPAGVLCEVEGKGAAPDFGDVVHPCVRYIPDGFNGHTWWMVYTPYYKANAELENPILCYADGDSTTIPTRWKVFSQVQNQPKVGYNSDPTLLYDEGRLFVMWRENSTERCSQYGADRATFCAEVLPNRFGLVPSALLSVVGLLEDTEVSPTFLRNPDGGYRALAMHLRFSSRRIAELPPMLRKIATMFVAITDLLFGVGQQKSFGISQWISPSLFQPFELQRTVQFMGKNPLYRPWHMDFFEYENRIYAIVQTNQSNADICLAYSEDGVQFKFYKKPLMTNASSGKVGIYKPTGGVVEGVFFLYYTAQDKQNRALNRLYLSQMNFNEMIKERL